MIEAAAEAGIRPIICRQERVGVGIADGYSRATNGRPPGVFAMQYGPGAENAYAGVATAFSDAVPMLLLPLGHPTQRDGVFPLFSSMRSYESVTKRVELLNSPGRVVGRHAALVRRDAHGPPRPGDAGDSGGRRQSPKSSPPYSKATVRCEPLGPRRTNRTSSARRGSCWTPAVPVIHAGQGTLYADATPELVEAFRAASGAGDDHDGGQERVSGRASTCAGQRLRRDERPVVPLPGRSRRGFRSGHQLHQARHDHPHPAGQDHDSRYQRPRRHRQGLPHRPPVARRRQADSAPGDRMLPRAFGTALHAGPRARSPKRSPASGRSGWRSGRPSSHRTRRRSRPTASSGSS